MKPLCFLFLTIACALWIKGTTYAAPPQQTAAESSTNEDSANLASGRLHDDHPHDAGNTATPDGGKRQKEANRFREQQASRGPSNKNHLRGRASLTAASHPKLPSSGQRAIPRNASNLRQPGSHNSAGAARGGLVPHQTLNSTLPVRSASIVRPIVASLNPSLNNVRHRSPNPAIVGGPENSDKSTAAINGTAMHHKP
jgi:hypothetical protein